MSIVVFVSPPYLVIDERERERVVGQRRRQRVKDALLEQESRRAAGAFGRLEIEHALVRAQVAVRLPAADFVDGKTLWV
jgi:hypothetical protein